MYLGHNLFTGALPSITAAPNLETFDASNNLLSGPLPLDTFAEAADPTFSARVSLRLDNNPFTGPVPSAICTLPGSLRILRFSENHMPGPVPSCILLAASLPNLTQLEMGCQQPPGTAPLPP